ncbi:MAG: hypothetical protein NT069_22390 [Planctomycetota bacterium]|nr:hypothetical protein [Planctomycetota bacterium]
MAAYNNALRELCDQVAPEGEVELIEYDDLLGEFASEFEQAYAQGLNRVAARDPELFAVLRPDDMFESVRCSLNTAALGMTYADLEACFGPGRDRKNRFEEVLARQTEESTASMLAVRHACRTLELRVFARRFGPNYVRATIHVARVTPILGLRIYPDYKRSSQQLPYHGVPLLERERDQVKMLVAPECRFWRDATLERVTHHDGETFFYQRRAD